MHYESRFCCSNNGNPCSFSLSSLSKCESGCHSGRRGEGGWCGGGGGGHGNYDSSVGHSQSQDL